MKINIRSFSWNYIFYALYFLLFLYVAFRAYNMSFTHDESLSFSIVNLNSVVKDSANNHFLNTWLMWLFNFLFGSSEFSLRLPNVLSFLVYSFFCLRFLNRSENFWLVLLGTCLFLFNPFVLDFFSLARGYGLSLTFIVSSLYFLLKESFIDISCEKFFWNFIFSMLFAVLALLSNFATVNYFIAIVVVFSVQYFWLSRKYKLINLKFIFIFGGILLLFCIPLLFSIIKLLELKDLNQLYYGTESLYYAVKSLFCSSIFVVGSYWISHIFVGLLIVIIFVSIFLMIRKKIFQESFSMILYLIVLIFIGLLIERYFFGQLYPMDRTSLYLYPLFALLFYYFVMHLIKSLQGKTKMLFTVFLSLFCFILSLVNFFSDFNFLYTRTWKYDARTKDVVNILEEKSKGADINRKFVLSNNWVFEPTLNFYISGKNLNFEKADRSGLRKNSDFIYDFSNEAGYPGFIKVYSWDDIGTTLFQRTDF